jgi:hypothetical protein
MNHLLFLIPIVPKKIRYKDENGEYKNSIYISEVTDGEYQKAYLIGAPICKGNTGEEVIGLSANGKTLLMLIKDSKVLVIFTSAKRMKTEHSKNQ